MATYRDGYLGAFNGKLGPAVAYTWKGRLCLRSHQPRVKDPRTARQQRQRTVFGVTSSLAAAMAEATQIGLRGLAAERQANVLGTFVHLNSRCVSVADGEVTIDYASVRVAAGGLEGVSFGEPQAAAGRRVEVSFTRCGDGAGEPTDYVYLFVYAPSLGQGFLSQPAKRFTGCVADTLPTAWAGLAVLLYGFAWDTDLSASDSAYIGTIQLQP